MCGLVQGLVQRLHVSVALCLSPGELLALAHARDAGPGSTGLYEGAEVEGKGGGEGAGQK